MIDPDGLALGDCPHCAAPLAASGWSMPGMRLLGRTRCGGCGRDYFVDLPAGQGLYSPMILDAGSGAVHDHAGVPWFANWLRESYRHRSAAAPGVSIERHAPVTRPVVLINCLDTLYGHALLKLLNAQQYLDAGTVDVVAIVQPCLRALVPDGVAETWTVALPLGQGTMWSDELADRIAVESARFADLRIAPIHPHPHPSIFSIERFSRVPPFPLAQWEDRLERRVTFIWRGDRIWSPPALLGRRSQTAAVTAFFEALRDALPGLDAAVAGIGARGGLPGWITDLRCGRPSAGSDRDWLHLYAGSHAVIGVHGSNMLLPSAHAGSTFELLPADRQSNILQDIIFNGDDPRDLFFRYRFLDAAIAPAKLASQVALVVSRYPDFARLMSPGMSRDADVRA